MLKKQRYQNVSCWHHPKQSGSVRRKPEKYTSIHLNSKKICNALVFRRAEMASWYWYLRIYQRFLRVSTWVLGFWWTKREGRNHVFLSDFGLLWTILDFLWCRGRDSNPHSNCHYPLKIACLPVPPPRHELFIYINAAFLASIFLRTNQENCIIDFSVYFYKFYPTD